MKTKAILKQLEHLKGLADKGIAQKQSIGLGSGYIPQVDYLGFKPAALSFITLLYGDTHTYSTMFKGSIKDSNVATIQGGINILDQIKHEVENGWLTTVKELVTAEVFSDFLEMGEHLLEEGYKDAAAVMIGSVLEEHMRQLCATHKVEIHELKGTDNIAKKASRLNDDLKKEGVYGPIEQKQVVAWLGIRNSAAHGKYTEYNVEQVQLMYQGVLGFISRVK
jgi:hypothetical protein